MLTTCEDCIEQLLGFKKDSMPANLSKQDFNFFLSIGRQVGRKIGMTDRQHNTIKEKIISYKLDLEEHVEGEFDNVINTLRIPIREIDRSRYIKVDEFKGQEALLLRFIFNKKLISKLEALKKYNIEELYYDKQDKIHYYNLDEKTLFTLVTTFKDSGFEIEEKILEVYEKLLDMKNNKNNYVPGIYNFKLKNLTDKAFDYILSSAGTPDKENLYQFYDQRDIYGLNHFDEGDLQESYKRLTPLTKRIIQRTASQIQINPKEFTLEMVVESITELVRFPLVILLDEKNPHDDLTSLHSMFSGIVQPESMCVLFRLDNSGEGVYFNKFIKDNNLNNTLDKSTKIVYISTKKVPKPLLASEWYPKTVLTLNAGRMNSQLDTFIEDKDLVIYYDADVSPFKRNVQKI